MICNACFTASPNTGVCGSGCMLTGTGGARSASKDQQNADQFCMSMGEGTAESFQMGTETSLSNTCYCFGGWSSLEHEYTKITTPCCSGSSRRHYFTEIVCSG